ncbi:hypothetical protein, partial [Paenibacillus sp. 598K]|uniref:hypothetical protein n=1 Tax=Paenibacillus sp. 598K TaxID=1117987 RepID=UPI001C87CD2D
MFTTLIAASCCHLREQEGIAGRLTFAGPLTCLSHATKLQFVRYYYKSHATKLRIFIRQRLPVA